MSAMMIEPETSALYPDEYYVEWMHSGKLQGLLPSAPDGLITQIIKTMIKTALDEDYE